VRRGSGLVAEPHRFGLLVHPQRGAGPRHRRHRDQARARRALALSSALRGIALFGFGWLKAAATGLPRLRGAVQTLAIGGTAAVVAYLVASLFGH
jgi:apolipoprotein N-acyltransferase